MRAPASRERCGTHTVRRHAGFEAEAADNRSAAPLPSSSTHFLMTSSLSRLARYSAAPCTVGASFPWLTLSP